MNHLTEHLVTNWRLYILGSASLLTALTTFLTLIVPEKNYVSMLIYLLLAVFFYRYFTKIYHHETYDKTIMIVAIFLGILINAMFLWFFISLF